MDFGVVGSEGGGGYVCSDTADLAVSSFASSDVNAAQAKNKWYGSGLLKQERSGTNAEDVWRGFKVAKTSDDDFSATKAMLFQQKSSLLRSNSSTSLVSDGQQQMLSFSSPNSHTVTLPYYTSTAYNRNAGYGNGGFNGGNMNGGPNGVRGPFTPSQWMKLEHQALIYKYITSNVPIPSYLLNPIRKALDSAGFSSFAGLRSNALGWGAFHLGFSNNTDPEPGRCRRTDGKKWRCSRDAVADQKYCERHMNRGRHRSRKPVEGQAGHSVSGITGTTTKLAVTSTASAAVVPGGGSSKSLGLSHRQLGNLQHGATNSSSASHQLNRNYGGSGDLNDRGSQLQHQLRQFMDDYPKNRSESSVASWSNIDVPSDGTQLSISIPTATSDYRSPTLSPNKEKLTVSPLRLLPELEATQMGLGVGSMLNEQNHRQGNLIPISWESSMGGPLGEVLHSTNNSAANCKNTSALNLMREGWDSSPRMASSPTGVLQKAAFGSLSNSSARSSPTPENSKTHEGASLCSGLFGSTLIHPSLPAL